MRKTRAYKKRLKLTKQGIAYRKRTETWHNTHPGKLGPASECRTITGAEREVIERRLK